ncbi:uncharacterized protein PV09_04572 [Verruconis gallopava]|uniref:Mid2 domain-containing protein n=1 Tax=Verruconis gallopava TaxID=253628 RepID=A0A0D2ACS3_9PEZI|nr:uncharacterized protein PV09_04572 [Verruconis gallopava]KIW04270.1 hypothetical protein PV09_04572 [Verruconis gallopava]
MAKSDADNAASNSSRPIFFYSSEKDLCAARDFAFSAPNNTELGDLCVYIDEAPVRGLWACPAGEDQCWTIAKPCLGSGSKQASSDQIQCTASNSTWCCNRLWEMCSSNGSQTEICLAARFDNPLANVDASVASQIAKDAIASSQTGVMLTVPTAVTEKVSTVDMVVPGINIIPASESASFTLTSAFASGAATTTSASSTTTALLNSMNNMPASKLSAGAIAGIVVAALGLIILACIVAFLVRRRRKQRATVVQRESPSESNDGLLAPSSEAAPSPQPPMAAVTPPAAAAAAAPQAISPPATPKIRTSHSVRSGPVQDMGIPLENESLLEPSPLQTLMIHGRYPNR